MPKASASLTQKAAVLQARRRALLGKLAQGGPLIGGNVYDVMRRCGNPSCHCAAKPGHRQTLLIYMEGGRRRCKFVRRADAPWVKQAWERNRECRRVLQELRALQKRELEIARAQIQGRMVSYG